MFTVVPEVTARSVVMVKHATTFSQKLRIIWVFLIYFENILKSVGNLYLQP